MRWSQVETGSLKSNCRSRSFTSSARVLPLAVPQQGWVGSSPTPPKVISDKPLAVTSRALQCESPARDQSNPVCFTGQPHYAGNVQISHILTTSSKTVGWGTKDVVHSESRGLRAESQSLNIESSWTASRLTDTRYILLRF